MLFSFCYVFRFHLIDTPSPEISKTGSHSKNQSITESESSVHMSSVVWCDSHVCWCDSSYGDNCPVLFNHSFTCCYTGCQGNYWWTRNLYRYYIFQYFMSKCLNFICLYTNTVLLCFFRFQLIDTPSFEISKTGSHSKSESSVQSKLDVVSDMSSVV